MQSFDTYGFQVILNDSSKNNEYLNIKKLIEDICSTSEKIAVNSQIKSFCHFYPINNHLSVTCSIYNGKAKLGLYDHNSKKILTNCRFEQIQNFNEITKNNLLIRMKNASKYMLNLSPIDTLWLEIRTQEKNLFQQVISGEYKPDQEEYINQKEEFER